MTFLGADAGISAGRVDEADDGQIKFLRQLHQAQRLAVAFGLGAAEVAHEVFLGIAAFLMADDHDAALVDGRRAADDGVVVAVAAVAV